MGSQGLEKEGFCIQADDMGALLNYGAVILEGQWMAGVLRELCPRELQVLKFLIENVSILNNIVYF